MRLLLKIKEKFLWHVQKTHVFVFSESVFRIKRNGARKPRCRVQKLEHRNELAPRAVLTNESLKPNLSND